MRVLLVSAVPPPEGGIATWTQKYLSYCKKNNVMVELVNTALQGKRGKKINADRNFNDEIKRTLYILYNTRKKLKEFSPDVMHLNSSCSAFGIIRDFLCAQIAKHYHVPLVLHCHCNIEDQVQHGYAVYFLKRMIDVSSSVIVLNNKSYEYIRRLKDCNVQVVPNFIETKRKDSKHPIRENITNVVFVGHVQRTKGCFEIMEVAKQLSAIKFTLVGPISDEITKCDIPSNVTLTGALPSDQVQNYLEYADLFLFLSYTEGFSLALTEAMECGLPCIATDVGSNRDMLENYGGIIVEDRSTETILSAISILQNPEIRESMSQWNMNKVRQSYSMDKVMSQLFQIYKKVS